MYLGAPSYLSDEEQQATSSGRTPSRSPSDTLPYREALEETERKQREEYLRDCADVTVLETLERQSLTPGERVRHLERKLAAMPRIVRGYELITDLRTRRLTGRLSPAQFRAAISGVLHAFPELGQFPFPRGYAVRSVGDETAIVKCQLSRARWEFMVWNRTRRIPGRLGQITDPLNPDPADALAYFLSEAEIKKQLERNFRADDEPGYLDRRRRLRLAFQSVPKSFAQNLFGRLLDRNDPLAKLFRYKIHTATQGEMISILQKKLDVI